MGQRRSLALRCGTAACSVAVALVLAGCQTELDMAKAYDAKGPATTIPYAGVRPELRQYADYGTIHANILTGAPPARP